MTVAVSPVHPYPFLRGGGELALRIADHDWAATALGPIDRWPQTLRTTVGIVLRAHVPLVTLWGEAGVMIYNDAYARFAAGRHPRLLGSRVREGWPEVADFNDHVVTVGLAGGTLSYEDQELTLYRNGVAEQVWMDLDYSPILDDAGTPCGVLAIVIETTGRVMAERWRSDEQDRLQRMFEQAPGFMAMLRAPEQVFEFVNEAYRNLIGHRPLQGLAIREALPELATQDWIRLLDEVCRTGRPTTGVAAPMLLARASGAPLERRYLDFVNQPVRDGSGAVVGVFVQGSDVTDRVEAEAAVRVREAQFHTFAQAMPNQVWTSTPDGRLDWCNEQVYRYGGLRGGDFDAAGLAAIVHPADRSPAAARWADALRTGDTYETEVRLRRHDGAYRWHLTRALPIRAPDGRIEQWIGTNTDIDEQKRAEAENARDRDRLWTMSRDLMLVCDFDGRITAVNPSATRLLKWAEAELVGRAVADLVHPADLPSTIGEIARLASGIAPLAFENRFRTKDGVYKLLDWTAVPDAGRIHAVGRDITESRTIAADQARIWTLSPVLKAVCSPTGAISKVNPAWTETLGWSADESAGRSLASFADPADGATRVALDRVLGGDALRDVEMAFLTKDGTRRRIAWSFVLENDGLFGFGRDVTEQRNAEDALRQSQKMEAVGQLTGGIAHDFNNLLQGITGSLDLVRKRVSQGRTGELERYVHGAMASARKASALTHRLLAFSRRQPLDPRPVEANPLVTSMEDLLRRTLGERIVLDLKLAAALWQTKCDPNQLENAILNLAINARDAMPDGGRLVIETANAKVDGRAPRRERSGEFVCIAVRDTGTGMTAETVAHAFEPFFTTKPIGQGTGLGLSMIYGFAMQSEGFASIDSEVGRGTTVSLCLPRHRGSPVASDDDPPRVDLSAAEAGETVLVVEDEFVVRGLVVEVLRDFGYRVLEAADGPDGVAVLQSDQRIDLLITDVGLPRMNGRQVADAGRERRPGIKVLFMTGYAENAALASGFLEPGMAMITKPFAIEALAARIRDILRPG